MNVALGLLCTLKEVTAEDLTIQKSDEGSKVSKLQSYACGEDNGKQTHVRDEQRLCEDILQMTFKHAAKDSTIQMNEGRKVRKLHSSACVQDTCKQIQVCDQQRLIENMLQMTVERAIEYETIQMNEEGREVRILQSSKRKRRKDGGRKLLVGSKVEADRRLLSPRSSRCGKKEMIFLYCMVGTVPRRGKGGRTVEESFLWDRRPIGVFYPLALVDAVDFLGALRFQSPQSPRVSWRVKKQEKLRNYSLPHVGKISLNMLPKNRLSRRMKKEEKFENYGLLHVRKTSESEEGREIIELQSSACGENTEKRTQTCDQQRLTESMLQMNVAVVQYAIDLKSTNDIVLVEKDLQSEQITNTSEEISSSSASDFQSAGGKVEKLKAVRRENKGGWVSKKGTCLGSIHNKLTSIRKKNLQALSDCLLSCQHDALGRTRSKVLSEAKQILLVSGWVFGTIEYDSHCFYYDSSGGQCFHSFALAYKAWQEEQEAEIAQSIMDDQGDEAGTDSFSPSPMEVCGHKMWKMMKGHRKCWGKELQPTYSP
ncbi:hypothetical protein ACLOJK_018451 [Asimina triloba]